MAKATELWPQLSDAGGFMEERPKAVIIHDEVYPVSNWRDVTRRPAEFAVQRCGEKFEEQVVSQRPGYFARSATGDGWYPLKNDWRVYVNNTADVNKNLSVSIVEGAGIPEEEYEIVLW